MTNALPKHSLNWQTTIINALHSFKPLKPIRHWLESIKINSPQFAHWLCRSIPARCPFARDISLFGRIILHIPPLCKLNPFYNELINLRFRALCYLSDVCCEDISSYC
jgi:hypothetical protein